jgi:hypothetical protein
MSDRAASMATVKRRINDEKHERVTAVIAQIKSQGRDDDLKATIIARRAGVHRSFVHNHFAGLAADHPQHSLSSAAVTGLRVQVEQLLGTEVDLRRQLRDTEEELEAARRLNRTLIRERNSNATDPRP